MITWTPELCEKARFYAQSHGGGFLCRINPAGEVVKTEFKNLDPLPTQEQLEAVELPEPLDHAALAAARLQMAQILDALPVVDRAIVLPIRFNVETALDRGDLPAAYLMVSTAAIPEHLETIRAQILALFPS